MSRSRKGTSDAPDSSDAGLNGHGHVDFDAVQRAVENDPENKQPKGPSQATRLIELAGEAEEYCHDSEGRAHARLPVQGAAGPHTETWPVRSKGFRDWLCRRFYIETGKAPSAQAMNDALGVLDARGRFDG